MAIIGSLLKRGIRVGNMVTSRRKINPFKQQKRTLSKLVSKARYTEFGEKYKFEEILSSSLFNDSGEFYEKFKKIVPVYDYNKIYKEWWHRLLNGEKDITWPRTGKVFCPEFRYIRSLHQAYPRHKCHVEGYATSQYPANSQPWSL